MEDEQELGTPGLDFDSLYDKTRKPQEVIDRIIEIQFDYIQPSACLLFDGSKDQLHNIVIKNQAFYNTLCSLYTSRRILELSETQTHIAEAQKQLAEQQTKIAERQEEIAKGIKASVDESTNVAKHVSTLTIIVGFFTLVSTAATVIGYWVQIKALFNSLFTLLF